MAPVQSDARVSEQPLAAHMLESDFQDKQTTSAS
jgi:hypothetical protein